MHGAFSVAVSVQSHVFPPKLEERTIDVGEQAEQLRKSFWLLLRAQDDGRRHIAGELMTALDKLWRH